MALKPKEHFHGSDLEKIEAVYGIKKEDIISFSANVNPLGVSFRLKETLTNHIDAITTYPDREYTSLRKCIADYVHTNYKNIVVGNGSTELISLFIQITHPMKALIVGPTYSNTNGKSQWAADAPITSASRKPANLNWTQKHSPRNFPPMSIC